MIDVPFRDWSKASPEIKTIFQDPVARAIWMAYRLRHIIDDHGQVALINSAREIAEELRQKPLERARIALWFKRKMRPVVDEEFASNMVPYLVGEKVAISVPM